VEQVALYLDHKLDESYTPSLLSIRVGSNHHDLQELKQVALEQPTGWVVIPLLNRIDESPPNVHMVQIAMLENHESGKDTHVRQVKVFGPERNVTESLRLPRFESVEFTQYCVFR